jgi:hypothetical protein
MNLEKSEMAMVLTDTVIKNRKVFTAKSRDVCLHLILYFNPEKWSFREECLTGSPFFQQA